MPQEPETPARRVLVVDDDAEFRTLAARALAADGHVVRVARDGAEARAMLSQVDVEVVVTDILMPVLDGIELIRWIREEQLPIAVLAVSGGSATLAAGAGLTVARALGADAILYKPFELEELRRSVDALMRSA